MRVLTREFQKNTGEKFEICKRFYPSDHPLAPPVRRIKRALARWLMQISRVPEASIA